MHLTEYNNIYELLQKLLSEIQHILTNKFIGMYIGGSIATRNFHLETSDIDCYIITKNTFSNDIIQRIEKMHNKFYSSQLQCVKKIEASYIPQQDIMNFNPHGLRPYFNEGQFYMGEYGSNYIIELYVLRENGITIAGPDIKSLIPEISIENLRQAILNNLHEYWKVALGDVSKFNRSDYQAFAILTMCRTLYTLQTGRITSKIKAAEWALEKLDNKWESLIEQALAWKPNQEIDKIDETQQFVKYVLNKVYVK